MRCFVLMILLGIACELAAEDLLQVNVSVKPESDATVKQPVTISLEVLTPNWFAKEPKIVLPTNPQWVMVETPLSKGPISKNLQGKTWSGILVEYAAYPISAGQLGLGKIDVVAEVANPGASASQVKWQSEPITVSAVMPKGVKNLDQLIVASDVNIKEQWQIPENPKVGDSLIRTITIEAEGTQSMLIPETHWPRVEGARLYEQKPILNNSSNRGTAKATRKQELQYTLEHKGKLRLSTLSWQWYNVETQQLQTVSVPEKEIEVKGSPLFTSGESKQTNQSAMNSKWLFGLAVMLASMVLLAVMDTRFKSNLIAYWKQEKQRFLQRPRQQFRGLLHCIDNNTPQEIIRRCYSWIAQLSNEVGSELKNSNEWLALQKAAIGQGELNRAQLKNRVTSAYYQSRKSTVKGDLKLPTLYPDLNNRT